MDRDAHKRTACPKEFFQRRLCDFSLDKVGIAQLAGHAAAKLLAARCERNDGDAAHIRPPRVILR